jgi:peptide/nickel transport system permease protein
MTFVLIGISAHPIWIGLIFAYIFGFRLGWFPISNYCDFFPSQGTCGGPAQWAYHLFLPWLTYAILFAALYARMVRANVMEALTEDYVRTARAKGLPPLVVDRRHVLRNALLPITTIIGLQTGLLLSGAVLTETVFAWPGMGSWLRDAIFNRDYPVLQGGILFLAVVFVIVNLIVDLSYAVINPRIRYS